jgi:rhodanese-related sulfurtransferase
MIVIDLRGQDRACGAIPGTKNIPAMDLLKEIGKYVKDFEEKQIVAFFCQYSAHRAPTAAGCMCSNTLSYYIIYNIYILYYIYIILYIYILCVFYCFLISRVYHNPSKATLSAGENQSNKVANFFRKSCPSKQRVMILEGGYRGWEAHDLPIQQMEAALSQKACDELAVKIGKDVSKLPG